MRRKSDARIQICRTYEIWLPDVFVHASAVERANLGSLHEGQKLSFEVEKDNRSGKFSAGQLERA